MPDSLLPQDDQANADMSAEDFRQSGYRLIDWIATFFENVDGYPVLPAIQPGDIRKMVPESAPESGEPMADILEDVDRVVMPGMTHWNHPSYFAYFSSTGSGPGILGELLGAALNNNGMLWKSCPSSTELEQVTLDWLRQMLGLPEKFWPLVPEVLVDGNKFAVVRRRPTFEEMTALEQPPNWLS